jgi:hypothetical protein
MIILLALHTLTDRDPAGQNSQVPE